jgi:hypothetical protein
VLTLRPVQQEIAPNDIPYPRSHDFGDLNLLRRDPMIISSPLESPTNEEN